MFCLHQLGIAIAIAFGSEDGVRRATDPAQSVLRPNARVVLIVTIVDQHHLGRGMNLLKPGSAQGAGDGLGWSLADDNNNAIAS